MKATASVKIGPISARFSGAVHLSDIDPPNGYTIRRRGPGRASPASPRAARKGAAGRGGQHHHRTAL
ncbi:MAG: SRPBCC domain-containing protein [Acetobacteraceae bacterium]